MKQFKLKSKNSLGGMGLSGDVFYKTKKSMGSPSTTFLHSQKSSAGFTLIEMLMTIFILIIIVVGASGIYVYSVRAQQKTLQLNIVAQDVQYLFDVLSRKAREGAIDYEFYEGAWVADEEISDENISGDFLHKNVLAIYNANQDEWIIGGETYYYRGAVVVREDDHLGVCFCESRCGDPEVLQCGSTANPFIPLTADSLEIIDLEFKIMPDESPFGLAYGSDPEDLEQPRMTMQVELEGAGETMSVQQTIPQRFIERR